MNDQPCPSCGSYADECQCEIRREYSMIVHALGMAVEPRWADANRAIRAHLDYDSSAIQRALREYGYR